MPRFNDPTTELTYLEKDDVLMSGSPSDFANIKAQNLFNRSLTRVQLQALITASELNIGQDYTITNAVSSTYVLKVTACAVNEIETNAINTANGDAVIYDITTDTLTTVGDEFTADITVNTMRIGRGSGNKSTNAVFGNQALNANVSGEYNVAIGFQALLTPTASSYNTAIGLYALTALTTGYGNTAIGAQALFRNTTGRYNLAIGLEVMANNTTGLNNVALGGYDTMLHSTTADSCVAIGYAAMYSNISGSNVAIGANALYLNTAGNNNTILGTSAGYNTTTSDNTFIGVLAGYNNTTGYNNISIGRSAGVDNTTGTNNLVIGSYNRGITTGSSNTIIGNNVNVGNVSNNIVLALGDGTVKGRYDGTGWTLTGALAITNTVAASVATPSTHKVTMVIGGTTYYLLATNA